MKKNSFIIFSYSLFRRLYVIHQLYDVSINHPHNQPSSYIKNAHGKNNSRSRGHCMQKYFSTTFKVNYVVRFTTLLRIFELNHKAECRSNVIIQMMKVQQILRDIQQGVNFIICKVHGFIAYINISIYHEIRRNVFP